MANEILLTLLGTVILVLAGLQLFGDRSLLQIAWSVVGLADDCLSDVDKKIGGPVRMDEPAARPL